MQFFLNYLNTYEYCRNRFEEFDRVLEKATTQVQRNLQLAGERTRTAEQSAQSYGSIQVAAVPIPSDTIFAAGQHLAHGVCCRRSDCSGAVVHRHAYGSQHGREGLAATSASLPDPRHQNGLQWHHRWIGKVCVSHNGRKSHLYTSSINFNTCSMNMFAVRFVPSFNPDDPGSLQQLPDISQWKVLTAGCSIYMYTCEI